MKLKNPKLITVRTNKVDRRERAIELIVYSMSLVSIIYSISNLL